MALDDASRVVRPGGSSVHHGPRRPRTQRAACRYKARSDRDTAGETRSQVETHRAQEPIPRWLEAVGRAHRRVATPAILACTDAAGSERSIARGRAPRFVPRT